MEIIQLLVETKQLNLWIISIIQKVINVLKSFKLDEGKKFFVSSREKAIKFIDNFHYTKVRNVLENFKLNK